jgi:hypothetical protein
MLTLNSLVYVGVFWAIAGIDLIPLPRPHKCDGGAIACALL